MCEPGNLVKHIRCILLLLVAAVMFRSSSLLDMKRWEFSINIQKTCMHSSGFLVWHDPKGPFSMLHFAKKDLVGNFSVPVPGQITKTADVRRQPTKQFILLHQIAVSMNMGCRRILCSKNKQLALNIWAFGSIQSHFNFVQDHWTPPVLIPRHF